MDFEWSMDGDFLDIFEVKEKFGTQTAKLSFYQENISKDRQYWFVSFIVYTKRKKIDRHFNNCEITGEHGVAPLLFAKNGILEFEQFIVNKYPCKENIIVVDWANPTRKKIYCHFLPRYGFSLGNYCGKIVLLKTCVKR